jgi:hypothetical protein
MHTTTQLLQDAPADVPLVLGFGIAFDSLYRRDGLKAIDDRFVEFLQQRNPELHDRLAAARAAPDAAVDKMEKDLVVDLAPMLDDFTAELFAIAAEVKALRARDQALAPIYSVKRQFVQRRSAKKFTPVQAESFDGDALREQLERHLGGELTELRFSEKVESWLGVEAENSEALDVAARYAAWATHSAGGKRRHGNGVLFKIPHKIEPEHLVPIETATVGGIASLCFPQARLRQREGFALTDSGTGIEGALDQANYCIWCHNQGKDSCAGAFAKRAGNSNGMRSASSWPAARWKKKSPR